MYVYVCGSACTRMYICTYNQCLRAVMWEHDVGYIVYACVFCVCAYVYMCVNACVSVYVYVWLLVHMFMCVYVRMCVRYFKKKTKTMEKPNNNSIYWHKLFSRKCCKAILYKRAWQHRPNYQWPEIKHIICNFKNK